MKARRFLAWVVTALLLLTSFALPAPLGGAREAEALSLEDRVKPDASADDVQKEAKDVYTGKCGPKLNWSFNSTTGQLIITGSGAMYDYWVTPWEREGFNYKVKSISLPKGLTSIGEWAFYNCNQLTSISIPSKVKSIGKYAFEYCGSLTSISIPKSVTEIKAEAFSGCDALKHVYYQGTAAQRSQITIKNYNDALTQATWHYAKNASAALAIKTQPKNVTVKAGKTATFKVKATGATTIKWQYMMPSDPTWYDWGYTGSTLSLVASTGLNGYLFRCLVSNGTSTLESVHATLTVTPVQLAIKSNPKTVKAEEGKKITFKVKATGAAYYEWQILKPGESWEEFYYYVDGYSDSLTMPADPQYDGCYFRCKVSDGMGGERYSNAAKLCVKIKIKTKPKSVKVNEGESAYFSVLATGATGYLWQYRRPGEKVWYNLGGGDDAGWTITALSSYNGLSFRCKVYNRTSYKYTSAVKLTVKNALGSTGARRALLVGENDYPSSPLKGCINDMYAMAGMLGGLKQKYSVKTLPNSTKKQIMNAISSTFAGATSKSVSLFYYSGHGLSSSYDSRLGALVAIDEQTITFSELASALSKVNGRVIVILDSCFSGASINKATGGSKEDLDKMIQAYNDAAISAFSGYRLESDESVAEKSGELAQSKFVVITASSKTETSHDYYFDGSDYRQGQFTAALIKGMGCTYPNGAYFGKMPADVNGDNLITLGEIYKSAYNRALDWDPSQHAKYYGNASEVLFRRK